MISLIKHVFIVLFSFSNSLSCVAKVSDQPGCLSLINEQFMVRPTLINLNPIKHKCYSLMISLDKFNENCNVLPPKICVLKNKT